MGRRRREGLCSCQKAEQGVIGAPGWRWEQGDRQGLAGAGPAHRDLWLSATGELLSALLLEAFNLALCDQPSCLCGLC